MCVCVCVSWGVSIYTDFYDRQKYWGGGGRPCRPCSDAHDTWLLRFYTAKCKSMHLGRQNTKHKYCIQEGADQITVEQVAIEKDIGVTFDNELKFSNILPIV